MAFVLVFLLYVFPKLHALVYFTWQCIRRLLPRIRDGVVRGIRAPLALIPRQHTRARPVARAFRVVKGRVDLTVVACANVYLTLRAWMCLAWERTRRSLLRVRGGVVRGVGAPLPLIPRERARLGARPVAGAFRSMKERAFVASANVYLTLRTLVCSARDRTRRLLLRVRDGVVRGVEAPLAWIPRERAGVRPVARGFREAQQRLGFAFVIAHRPQPRGREGGVPPPLNRR